jgi:ACS family hexuronate transporter-like MFS transporter
MQTQAGQMPLKRGLSAWFLVVVATLTMSVSYVDRQTFAVVAPSVTAAFGIDQTHYGWLVSAFSIAYLVFAPLSGIAVDRYGARWGLALAIVVWSVIAGAHALAGSFASLFVLRLLLGTAESPSFPSAAQAIRRVLPDASRPLAIGLLFTGSSIGSVIAAKLGVALDAAFGFRMAFLATGFIGLAWLPLWLVASHGHGLEQGAPPPQPAERSSKESFTDVLRDPAILRTVIAAVGTAPSIMFVLNWTAKYLTGVWSVDRRTMGNYLTVAPLFFDVAAIGFGWIQSTSEKSWPVTTGRSRPTHNGLLIAATALTVTIALVPLARSPGIAVLLFATSAAGSAGIYGLVTSDMLARVPVQRAAHASGMGAAAQAIAYVIAGPLVGWSIDRTHGYATALVALGLIVVPTSAAFLIWPGAMRKKEA